MNYIDQIFARADIQQVRAFLQNGADCAIDTRTYQERIDSAYQALSACLHQDYPNKDDFDKITSCIHEYSSTLEDVTMEIGLQAGVLLAVQVAWNVKRRL